MYYFVAESRWCARLPSSADRRQNLVPNACSDRNLAVELAAVAHFWKIAVPWEAIICSEIWVIIFVAQRIRKSKHSRYHHCYGQWCVTKARTFVIHAPFTIEKKMLFIRCIVRITAARCRINCFDFVEKEIIRWRDRKRKRKRKGERGRGQGGGGWEKMAIEVGGGNVEFVKGLHSFRRKYNTRSIDYLILASFRLIVNWNCSTKSCWRSSRENFVKVVECND